MIIDSTADIVIKNNILIVDDHPFIIEGYKNAITRYHPEQYSFYIDQAKDCQSAYNIITNPDTPIFDIAFLDISMPPYAEKKHLFWRRFSKITIAIHAKLQNYFANDVY